MYRRWSIYDKTRGLKDWEERIQKRIDREYGKQGIKQLKKFTLLKNKKFLDVGSGCGEFVFEAVKNGAIGFGVEPDELSLKISKLLFRIYKKKAKFIKAYGEQLPFPSNYFDIVISNSTVEHVRNPERVLEEMVRVLKPGGMLWLKCPNFLYPFERHYKRFYIPLLPRFLQQLYFNILSKRWTKYFYHLKRITPFFILHFLKKNNLHYRNLSVEKALKSRSRLKALLAKFHLYPQIEFIITKP
jgi:ubiquinone/menaquinone biosynthesis C-methylase UbiE